eukprot:6489327-Amphidinium_carterae.1
MRVRSEATRAFCSHPISLLLVFFEPCRMRPCYFRSMSRLSPLAVKQRMTLPICVSLLASKTITVPASLSPKCWAGIV